MKKSLIYFIALFSILFSSSHNLIASAFLSNESVNHSNKLNAAFEENIQGKSDNSKLHQKPAPWSVIPFVLLLLLIAIAPLFFQQFWHKRYPHVSIFLGTLVIVYYVVGLDNLHNPIHSMHEYISFIALLTPLFIASGGVLIKVDRAGTPVANMVLLLTGAVIANIVGTTGASMLLIRPFIRINKNRVKPYHIVFFIFIVSNVGGLLTPVGDPPLFLGFLKGVPFFWALKHLGFIWIWGLGLLILIFYFFDINNKDISKSSEAISFSNKIEIKGLSSIVWIAITVGAVFLDPVGISWVPAIDYEGTKLSFIREIIMFSAAFFAYKTAPKECLTENEFSFEPIREVAFLFIGIFATMIPAIELVNNFANSEYGHNLISTTSLFWFTGSLSSILDNAPTYITFLAAGMGKAGLDINSKIQVIEYAQGENTINLMAISVAAVYFGAVTYIGNAPDFMVKSIAEQYGIKMPTFLNYITKYSLPILLPIFLLTWLMFFSGYFRIL